jgi:hypothetical protein
MDRYKASPTLLIRFHIISHCLGEELFALRPTKFHEVRIIFSAFPTLTFDDLNCALGQDVDGLNADCLSF